MISLFYIGQSNMEKRLGRRVLNVGYEMMRKENKTNFRDKAIRKKTTYLQKSPSIKVWDRPFCVPLRENAQKLIWACFLMYSSHTSLGKTFSSSHATTWGTVKYIDPPFQFRKAILSQSGRVPPPYNLLSSL